MKRTLIMLSMLLAFHAAAMASPKTVKLSSPDGKIRFTLSLTSEGPAYSIQYANLPVVEPSVVGFDFADGYFGKGLSIGKVLKSVHSESFDLPVGKTSHVESISNEAVIPLVETSGLKRSIEMTVRVFDDGVGFRYSFPEREDTDSLLIRNERMDVMMHGDPEATVLYLGGFQNSHEGPYTTSRVSALRQASIMDMPATFELENGVFVSITEAAVRHYPGMLLTMADGHLTSRLSPRLDRPELSVIAGLPHHTPWRVFMISDYVGDFISSNIITSLADPCVLDDVSWLKPGQTTFPWWCDSACPDSSFQWGNNFGTGKYYVDFAAANGIEYHSVYGYADTPWYRDDGPYFSQAGPNADLTTPAPTLDFARLCKYAESKGTGIHVWLNWKALYKDIDRVFDKFNEWGVKGMMVDFLDRDDQQMIEIQEEILAKAAEHHLFIQFHGACKPSGLSRTYPNEFTREGALNYEFFKGDGHLRVGGDHDLNIPFTRVLAGPTDFHLGGFHAIPRKDFRFKNHEPFVTVTRCHMIAMYVVLESYLAMVCDSPMAYEGQKGFSFLADIPTVWDETAVPACKMNEYVAVARRSGSDWWLGAITGIPEREIEIPLSFLGEGQWVVEMLTDAAGADKDPNLLDITTKKVTAGDSLTVRMASEGGAAMRFHKQ